MFLLRRSNMFIASRLNTTALRRSAMDPEHVAPTER